MVESFRALGVSRIMPRPYRRIYPSAALPTPRAQRKGGIAFSVALHIAIVALIVWERVPDVSDDGGSGGPGERGGGGGGGSGVVTFIQMPAYVPPRSELTYRVQRREPQPQVTIQPQVVVRPNISRSARVTRQIATRTIRSGRGVGSGLGRGPGSGGGIGTGEGTGTGSDRGPGTGGGGRFVPPSPRNISLPPQPTPGELKGKAFDILFSLDEYGNVTDVTVSPWVQHASYRERWMRQLRDFVFNPATAADGTPIPSHFTITMRI